MELVSGVLAEAQLWSEVGWLVERLQAEGVKQVRVAFGFGCDCDPADLYRDMPVDVSVLNDFLEWVHTAGICRVGEADTHISVTAPSLNVLLCHEGDVHVEVQSETWAGMIKRRWLAQGLAGHEKHGDAWVSLTAMGDGGG